MEWFFKALKPDSHTVWSKPTKNLMRFKEAYLFVIMCGIENTGEEVKV